MKPWNGSRMWSKRNGQADLCRELLRSVNRLTAARATVAFALAVTLTACAGSVLAQRSVTNDRESLSVGLIKGAGSAVCEAYEERIRNFPDLGDPMRIASPSEMRIANLGRASGGYVSESPLLRNVAEFEWKRDVNPARHSAISPSEWRGTDEQLQSAHANFIVGFDANIGSWGYYVARFDIDNDGEPDDVYYSGHSAGSILLILNSDRTTINVEKTARLLKHPSRQAAGWRDVRRPFPDEGDGSAAWVDDAYDGAIYLPLIYRGKYYVSFTWRSHPDYSAAAWITRRTSRLFVIEGARSEELCEFGFASR